MVNLSSFEYHQLQEKIDRGKKSQAVTAPKPSNAVEREKDLHQEIIDYCDAQWPRWKYIHARMDKRSGIEVGAQDFTIFMPLGKTLCIECKRKGAKPDEDQRNWAHEMERLGHRVHLVYSMDDFKKLL